MQGKSAGLTLKVLTHLVPRIRDEIVAGLRQRHGFLNFPPKFINLCATTIWSNFYEDRKKFKALLPALFLRFLSPEERAKVLALTPEEKIVFVAPGGGVENI